MHRATHPRCSAYSSVIDWHDGVIDTITGSCHLALGGSEHGATDGIDDEATPDQH